MGTQPHTYGRGRGRFLGRGRTGKKMFVQKILFPDSLYWATAGPPTCWATAGPPTYWAMAGPPTCWAMAGPPTYWATAGPPTCWATAGPPT
eukprot:gene22005-biopygen8708